MTPKQAETQLLEERGILATLEADLVGLKERHHELSREVDAERRGRSDPDRLTTLAGRLASLELLLRDQEADVEAATRRTEAAEAALRDAVETADQRAKREAYEEAQRTTDAVIDEALDRAFQEFARVTEALKAEHAAQYAATGRGALHGGYRTERYVAARATSEKRGPVFDAVAALVKGGRRLGSSSCAERREAKRERKREADEANRAQIARVRLKEFEDLDAFLRARGPSRGHVLRAREILAELEALGHPYEGALPPGVEEVPA